MQLARLSNLKHFLWLTILPLVGCTSHEHFNRPYSDQSGAKVVPSWCHNRVGPEELLLFFLGETKVEVTLLSDKEVEHYLSILALKSLILSLVINSQYFRMETKQKF